MQGCWSQMPCLWGDVSLINLLNMLTTSFSAWGPYCSIILLQSSNSVASNRAGKLFIVYVKRSDTRQQTMVGMQICTQRPVRRPVCQRKDENTCQVLWLWLWQSQKLPHLIVVVCLAFSHVKMWILFWKMELEEEWIYTPVQSAGYCRYGFTFAWHCYKPRK